VSKKAFSFAFILKTERELQKCSLISDWGDLLFQRTNLYPPVHEGSEVISRRDEVNFQSKRKLTAPETSGQ